MCLSYSTPLLTFLSQLVETFKVGQNKLQVFALRGEA
jgi:hypothetical protein